MSPQAQLLFAGAVEVVIGLTLAWCAYCVRKRHQQKSVQGNQGGPTDASRHSQVNRLNNLADLVGEHTRSVEAFQKWLEPASAPPLQRKSAPDAQFSRVQEMRDANRWFDEQAQTKSAELSQAAEQAPIIFQDVSTTFSDHRQRTNFFDKALAQVPPDGSLVQIQQLTFESMREVLASNHELETRLASAHRQIAQQADRLRAAERDARVDSLTHIPNRRAFDEHIDSVHGLYSRQGIVYSLVVLDIDHFKSLNDSRGHAAGDSVLQVIAKLLESQSRLSDRVFRLGGEEFVMVLVATGEQQAKIVAERARRRIETSIVYFEGRELRVTLSAGVATVRQGLTNNEVLEQADAALYSAKQAGRNCVESAPQSEAARR